MEPTSESIVRRSCSGSNLRKKQQELAAGAQLRFDEEAWLNGVLGDANALGMDQWTPARRLRTPVTASEVEQPTWKELLTLPQTKPPGANVAFSR